MIDQDYRVKLTGNRSFNVVSATYHVYHTDRQTDRQTEHSAIPLRFNLFHPNYNSYITLHYITVFSAAGAPAGLQARVGKNFFSFAHPGFQFAHPAIRNGCPPCPPYRDGFKGKGLVGH